ncbi:MAG: alpha-E domain-containing protein [Acidimicrobiales bacterium]|nr:alpha-E domain-containing protein [Acidimicrobiales bacterium]
MLGRTAGGMFWLFRYLERAENTTRLLEAGLRLALTRATPTDSDWDSVLTTAGSRNGYFERHDVLTASRAIDFVLRDETDPSSVASVMKAGRNSARTVRTALTRDVWEAINQCYLSTSAMLNRPVEPAELPKILARIRNEITLVSGALHGTMLRNETFNFARLGTHLERSDNTARILDVKYYVLLPSASFVGSPLDNLQWENILRSVSAERAFRWTHASGINASAIAAFLILDRRLPRSLAFCFQEIENNLAQLETIHNHEVLSHDLSRSLTNRCRNRTIDSIFEEGLHEFLRDSIADTNRLGAQIEADYRFNA